MTVMKKRFKCRTCGKEFAYHKAFQKHRKAHTKEEMMSRRKAQGLICGAYSKYWKDIKQCSIWGPRTIHTSTPIWEPDTICTLAFCQHVKGEPKNFHEEEH